MTALDMGIIISIFVAIIGCYVYVQRKTDELSAAQKGQNDCVEEEIKKLRLTLEEFKLDIATRMTRLETLLGEGTSPRKKK